jgi:hypothetical protein
LFTVSVSSKTTAVRHRLHGKYNVCTIVGVVDASRTDHATLQCTAVLQPIANGNFSAWGKFT